MFHRIWVTRHAKFLCPLRCCCCGAEDPEDVLRVVAGYRYKTWTSIFKRQVVELPVCHPCQIRSRMATWLVPISMILGTVLGAAIFVLLQMAFPNLQLEAALAAGMLVPLAGIIAFAVILFPTQVTAGFDSHWLVLGFRNREFAVEFQECNSGIAHME